MKNLNSLAKNFRLVNYIVGKKSKLWKENSSNESTMQLRVVGNNTILGRGHRRHSVVKDRYIWYTHENQDGM